MSILISKRFTDEFTSLIDKYVKITTINNECFEGKIIAANISDYSLWLTEVKMNGNIIPKLFISGNAIKFIEILELGPDLSKLAERLNRLFPNMVKYIKEAEVIVVMDRIRVTKDGIIEGTGPAAERVKKVYDEWIAEETQAIQPKES
ncbi:MAG: Lsm family RNA-binding protein [Nitrososphaerota archaeon]